MLEDFNIILAGVGGQGTLLASDILGTAAIMSGLKVQGSEALGMSQRGGSVVGHLRMGTAVYGPLVPEGKGDILIGFEPFETLRNISYLSKNGLIIVNTQAIVPSICAIGSITLPSINTLLDRLNQYAQVIAFDANELAKKAGSAITVNTVMIGALMGSGRFPLTKEKILEAIERVVPEQTVAMNKRAFDLGYNRISISSLPSSKNLKRKL